jgi:hypothetical protein
MLVLHSFTPRCCTLHSGVRSQQVAHKSKQRQYETQQEVLEIVRPSYINQLLVYQMLVSKHFQAVTGSCHDERRCTISREDNGVHLELRMLLIP